jgi:hypothetical protein
MYTNSQLGSSSTDHTPYARLAGVWQRVCPVTNACVVAVLRVHQAGDGRPAQAAAQDDVQVGAGGCQPGS